MKVVNYATYAPAAQQAAMLWPAHREYITGLHADGRLAAYGPFADGSGALYIYEVGSLAVAHELLAADPYQIAGIFASCQLCSWDIIRVNPALLTVTPVS